MNPLDTFAGQDLLVLDLSLWHWQHWPPGGSCTVKLPVVQHRASIAGYLLLCSCAVPEQNTSCPIEQATGRAVLVWLGLEGDLIWQRSVSNRQLPHPGEHMARAMSVVPSPDHQIHVSNWQ